MLQLVELNRRAREGLPLPSSFRTMGELEAQVDDAIVRLRRERLRVARTAWERATARIERRVDTDIVEYLDRPDHPAARKLRQVRWLHAQNVLLRSYRQFLGILEPMITAIAAANEGTPAKLVELASGSGELTLAIARLAQKRGLPVAITGTDIVPAYVRDAEERARREQVAASFRVLNAFDFKGQLGPGDIDLAMIVQSIHHFSPGQLAMMIAQASAAGARRFVGIDGQRGFLIMGLPVVCALSLDPYFVHDAYISTRRLYADAELALVASMAAPGARVSVRGAGFFLSVLDVELAGRS